MKKRVMLILSCLFLSLGFIVAQTIRIAGTVVDSNGESVVSASVVVKGTTVGTVTDVDGKFSINVPEGRNTLVFTLVGMKTLELRMSQDMRVVMETDEQILGDVVVTAIGISRSEKALGYAVGVISSDEMSKAREGNLINSLSGKVAGVNVLQNSGTAGGSSNIVIRGQTSLGGNSSPLFVIDGIPVSNSTHNLGINGGIDTGSRIGDISSDDIESMSVLKGAAATALYGARAKDGAIIITTKKGKKGKKTFVSVNSSYRFENPLVLPEYQNEYGPGNQAGAYSQVFNGWGPKISDVTDQKFPIFTGESVTLQAYKDNVKDYFETGTTFTNNVSIGGGDEKYDYRIGITALNQKGIIPDNSYDRYNFTFNGGRDFNNKLSARVSFSYIKGKSQGRPAQGSNDANVIMGTILTMPRTMDVNLLQDNWITQTGTAYPLGSGVSNTNNPYWVTKKNRYTGELDRVIGSMYVSYKPIENLTISNNVGIDFFYDDSRRVWAKGSMGEYGAGRFVTYNWNSETINNDLIATYDLKLNDDFAVKVIGGHNIVQITGKRNTVDARELLVADVYSYANAQSTTPTNVYNRKRLVGIYGDVGLSYRNFAYVNVTGRNDWSSTLPTSERSYFYPSISGSLIFTELIPKNKILDYGKIRVNYAQVGSDDDPYQLDYVYTPQSTYFLQYMGTGVFPHGGLLGYSVPRVYPDPNLNPQKQKGFEVGTDLRFFDGRISLDVTYYSNVTTNNIVSIDVPNSSGYFAYKKNAGKITNKGIEMMLNLVPVRGNFTWDVTFNFAKNNQKVKELDPTIQEYALTSGYNGLQVKAAIGEAFSLYGSAWERDEDGNFVINEQNGSRVKAALPKNLGKVAPDYTLGINNNFNYKNFNLSFLVDIKKGGVMYSGTASTLRTSGLSKETLLNNRESFVDKGVNRNSDGTYKTNETAVTAYDYWTKNYTTDISEANIFDASYVKLRELTFGYNLPKSLLSNFFVKNVFVGFEARNLWLIHSKTDHIDPELSMFSSAEVGSGVEFNSVPTTRSFGFNLKLDF
jgi:TonB-linked SusC/RagA family outer membrane protein